MLPFSDILAYRLQVLVDKLDFIIKCKMGTCLESGKPARLRLCKMGSTFIKQNKKKKKKKKKRIGHIGHIVNRGVFCKSGPWMSSQAHASMCL